MSDDDEQQDLHPLAQRTIDRLENLKDRLTGNDRKFVDDGIKQIRLQNKMVERLRQRCERLDRLEREKLQSDPNIFGGPKL